MKQLIFFSFLTFLIPALLPLQLVAQDDPHHQLVPFETIPQKSGLKSCQVTPAQ